MNDNSKTIGLSSLSALGVVIIAFITPSFFDAPNYYCESRPEIGVVQCDSFSKYVAANGKCIREDNSNLICREGWLLVVDDTILPEETIENKIIKNPEATGRIKCTANGCVSIEN